MNYRLLPKCIFLRGFHHRYFLKDHRWLHTAAKAWVPHVVIRLPQRWVGVYVYPQDWRTLLLWHTIGPAISTMCSAYPGIYGLFISGLLNLWQFMMQAGYAAWSAISLPIWKYFCSGLSDLGSWWLFMIDTWIWRSSLLPNVPSAWCNNNFNRNWVHYRISTTSSLSNLLEN